MPSPRHFQPLSDYEHPALATEAAVRRLIVRARDMISKNETNPVMANDRMRRTGDGIFDDVHPPPACRILTHELDETLLAWSGTPHPDQWLRLIVLPPGDRNDIVKSWATRHGHHLIEPPLRSDLVSSGLPSLHALEGIDPSGKGILVIPKLEDWFLRHRNGLGHLRGLIDWLSTVQRHCLIGCDTWAWAFAKKAARADMVLPDPLIFAPFDALRLRAWLLELAQEEGDEKVFRLSTTGDDIFALDEDGETAHDFFTDLAARSLGIPWVAWHLWRQSLRFGLDESGHDVAPQAGRYNGEDTIWITSPDPVSIPKASDRAPLFVLQALLLHGSLTVSELHSVLPLGGQTAVLPALIAAGIILREGDALTIRPSAYPAIREAIAAAGITLDIL